MEYFAIAFGVFFIPFCIYWIKNATSYSDMGYAIFTMIGAIGMLIAGIYLLV